MAEFRCKSCGGELDIFKGKHIAKCRYCQSIQTIPVLKTEKNENIYNRANKLRLNNEYDKASALYEELIVDNPFDADLYWSLVLCKYGIEYVEDPKTKELVPTINRSQYVSVFDDDNYQASVEYGTDEDKEIYSKEASKIDTIQKQYFDIVAKEEPFDIFICYKENDENGRTVDSLVANEVYDELVSQGYKVFFSRITLANKLGVAYEPYIFQALTTAKVMLSFGSSKENFESIWVKNEWSRYLNLIKQDKTKLLIPILIETGFESLPDEFKHLQAQDASKMDFKQELVRGINKLINVNDDNYIGTSEGLLKRANLLIEDGNFVNASLLIDKALNMDLENANIYLAALLTENNFKEIKELETLDIPLDNNVYYKRILKYGDEELIDELKKVNEIVTTKYLNTEEQIRKRKKRKKIIILTIVAIIAVGSGVAGIVYVNAKNNPVKIIEKIDNQEVTIKNLTDHYSTRAIIGLANYYIDHNMNNEAIDCLAEVIENDKAMLIRDELVQKMINDEMARNNFDSAIKLVRRISAPTTINKDLLIKNLEIEQANILVINKEYKDALDIYKKYEMNAKVKEITFLLLEMDAEKFNTLLSNKEMDEVKDIYSRAKEYPKIIDKYNNKVNSYITKNLDFISKDTVNIVGLVNLIDSLKYYDLLDSKYKLEDAYIKNYNDGVKYNVYFTNLRQAGYKGYKSKNNRIKIKDVEFEVVVSNSNIMEEGDLANGYKDNVGKKYLDLDKPIYIHVIANGKNYLDQVEYVNFNLVSEYNEWLFYGSTGRGNTFLPAVYAINARNGNKNELALVKGKGELTVKLEYSYKENGISKSISKDVYKVPYYRK